MELSDGGMPIGSGGMLLAIEPRDAAVGGDELQLGIEPKDAAVGRGRMLLSTELKNATVGTDAVGPAKESAGKMCALYKEGGYCCWYGFQTIRWRCV